MVYRRGSLALIEILITLAIMVVVGTVMLLTWATWYKRAEPVTPPVPDSPEASTEAATAPQPTPEAPEIRVFEGPLPPAFQVIDRQGNSEITTLYLRDSTGVWRGGVPDGSTLPASFADQQVRILLGSGAAVPMSQETLDGIMSDLNESMRTLSRDFSRMSLEGFNQSLDRMFTNVTIRHTTRTVAPQASATFATPKKRTESPPAEKEGPSRIDRLLSDDDVV